MDEHTIFLSTLPVRPGERRLAEGVLLLSIAVFAIIAPFAREPLARVWAFIPIYETWLIFNDLVTAALLYSQFVSFRSTGLYVVSCAYVYMALMTAAHALSFPGLFSPSGLLGAGPQTTAWLYMFWHSGFPLYVLVYTWLRGVGTLSQVQARMVMAVTLGVTLAAVLGFSLLATMGQSLLPPIMAGQHYTPTMVAVVSTTWGLTLLALVVIWRQRLRSVLDLWLTVVLCAWLFDIALSAVLNAGRFDLGFYAGRIYGLMAASFVLIVLLAESGMMYAKLVQLMQELQRLTRQDPLTGIANRRTLDAALDHEWRRATRTGAPLSLLMVDVDHFKLFNDHYGHVAGDQCLRAVAHVLQQNALRGDDVVARYGGEEFAVLLPDTDAHEAKQLAVRLCAAVRRLDFAHVASTTSPVVTISVGVSTTRPAWKEGAPVDAVDRARTTLIEDADKALYLAKTGGRNRVVVAGNEATAQLS